MHVNESIRSRIVVLRIAILFGFCCSAGEFVACASASSSEATLSRFEKLQLASIKSGVVEFTSKSLAAYATEKRNYSLVMIFTTASEQVSCPMCKPVDEQFKLVAEAFKLSLGNENFSSSRLLRAPVFFGRGELLKNQDVFRRAGWRSLPLIVAIPPNDVSVRELDPTTWIMHDTLQADFSAPAIADFVRRASGYPISLPEPANGSPWTLAAVSMVLGIVLVRLVLPCLWANRRNPLVLYALSVLEFALVMAGVVYNAIVAPPWWHQHPATGRPIVVFPSARQQFVAEGIIASTLLCCTGLLWFMLSVYVPTIKHAAMQRFNFFSLLILFCLSLHLLLKLFCMKFSHYPVYPF
eukprot:TRINITY_DN14387_c0_g1_i1.p1 TRINITY_DN14387_c0_g1~~TRINITY_DN14387_c0_g1_i1.p1  ORF type:complete len:353 (-),score=97.35 TRINITY_DN14387_c0_g1_i1:141-1199(-)